MILAILWGALVSMFVETTYSFKDCEAKNFEPKACQVEKVLYEVGK